MGSLSPIHLIILFGLSVLLFGGRGKVSGFMGDIANGIKAFKKNMADDTPDATMTTPGAGAAPTGKIAQEDTVKSAPVREPARQD